MSLYNIPYLAGKKSIISGYGLLFLGIAGLFTALGNCLMSLDVQQCYAEISGAYDPLLAAFMGLGVIGIAHKATTIENTTKDIKGTGISTEKTVEVIEETTERIEEATPAL
jgi:hypothetical protein